MILRGVLAAKASFRRARALGRWFGATSGIPGGSRLSRLLVLLTACLVGSEMCIRDRDCANTDVIGLRAGSAKALAMALMAERRVIVIGNLFMGDKG